MKKLIVNHEVWALREAKVGKLTSMAARCSSNSVLEDSVSLQFLALYRYYGDRGKL